MTDFSDIVVIDGVKLAELLRGPNGPVIRSIFEAAETVKQGARRRVGVYKPDPADPFAGNRTRKPGTLRDSIVKRVVQSPGDLGASVEVGSADPIALIHHEGTQPHTITARTAPNLVFFSSALGRVIRKRTVNHPGTQPNRYLTDSLGDFHI